jgi:alpha-tubulin suppressor-like RCC1 family protein
MLRPASFRRIFLASGALLGVVAGIAYVVQTLHAQPTLVEYRQIAIGSGHICARVDDGRVACWGQNYNLQLGDGTIDDSDTPVWVRDGANNIVEIAAGQLHTCGLDANGAVICWGSNHHHQLGLPSFEAGNTVALRMPNIVPHLPMNISRIDASSDSTCALSGHGTIHCWGYGEYGQFGESVTRMPTSPVTVALPFTATNLAVGAFHVCATTSSGEVQCWGYQHGDIPDGSDAVSSTVPAPISGLPPAPTAIDAGAYHTCALSSSGQIHCWGSNFSGQLGDGSTQDSMSAVQVSLPETATTISSGANNTCVIGLSGKVFCWGANNFGQLTNEAVDVISAPVQISGVVDVVGITVGEDTSCAWNASGGGYCWGSPNGPGAGSDAEMESSPVEMNRSIAPMLPGPNGPPTTGVQQLFGGPGAICARMHNQSLSCWGNINAVDASTGRMVDPAVPYTVSALYGLSNHVRVGFAEACVLITNGSVKCWGDSFDGFNAYASIVDSRGVTFTDITVGNENICGIDVDSNVLCWGKNRYGQADSQSQDVVTYPTRVLGLAAGAKQVISPNQFSCALLHTGQVQCWGTVEFSGYSRASATRAELAQDVVAIDGKSQSFCALFRQGNIRCWGRNDNPVMRNGTNVPLPPNAVSITVGSDSACAVMSDGAVNCWGDISRWLSQTVTPSSNGIVTLTEVITPILDVALGAATVCVRSDEFDVRCAGWLTGVSGSAPRSTQFVHPRLPGMRTMPTSTPTATATPSSTSTPTPSRTPTSTRTPMPTRTPSSTPAVTTTPQPSVTPSEQPNEPPTPTAQSEDCVISIDNAARFTSDLSVDIRATARTATLLLLSNDGSLIDGEWMPFSELRQWTFSDPGLRIATLLIYGRVRDVNGNALCGGASLIDDIIYDPLPPDLNITVLSVRSKRSAGTVILNAKDQAGGSGVSMMQVSNDPRFINSSWQPYRDSLIWNSGDGTIYVRVRDGAGNISAIATASTVGTIYVPFVQH